MTLATGCRTFWPLSTVYKVMKTYLAKMSCSQLSLFDSAMCVLIKMNLLVMVWLPLSRSGCAQVPASRHGF